MLRGYNPCESCRTYVCSQSAKPPIEGEEKIISQQILYFVVVHYGNFNALAAQAVMDAKKRHPEVTLTLLLPYPMSRIPAVCHCVCQPVHDRSQRLADCVCDARGQQRRAVSGGGAGAPWGAAGGEFGGGSTSQSASLTATPSRRNDSRALTGPPLAPLPRNRLAFSAAGGASPVSPSRGASPRGEVPPKAAERWREKVVAKRLKEGYNINIEVLD